MHRSMISTGVTYKKGASFSGPGPFRIQEWQILMYKAIQNDMVRQTVSGYYALQVLLHVSLNYRVEQRTESPTLLPTVKPLFIREKKKNNKT